MLTRSKERLCTLILRSGSATERERPHINVFEKTNKNFHNLSTTNKLTCKLISTQSNEKKIGKPPSSRVVLKIPSGLIQNLEDKDVKLEEKQVRSKGKMSKLEEFAWKKFACMDSSKSKILSKEEIVDLWSERECILSLFSEEESSISNNFKDFVEMLVESKTERSGLLNVVEFSELLKKFVKHLESKLRDESSYKRAKSTRAFQNINSSTGQQLKVLSAKIHNRLPNYLQSGLQTLSISNKKIPSILNQSHENLKKNTMPQQNPFHVQFKVRASSAFSNKNNNNNNYHNITQEQNGRINLDISSQSSSKTIDHNNEQSIFNDRVLLTSESQRQKKVPILKIQKILHPTLGLTSHLKKQTDKQIHYQNSNYKRYQIVDTRRNTNNFYNNNTGDSGNESQGNNQDDAFTKSSVDQMLTEPDQNQNLIQSNSTNQEQQQQIHYQEEFGQQEQQTAAFECTFKPSDLLSQCWNYQSNRSSHFSLEQEQNKEDTSRYFNFEENMKNIDFNDALNKISMNEDRSNNSVIHQSKRKKAPLLLDSCKKKLSIQNENENLFLLSSSSSSSKQNSNFMLHQQNQQQQQQQQTQTFIGIKTLSLAKLKNKDILQQQQQQSQDQNQFREIQPKRMFGEKIDLNCTKFLMKKEVRVVPKRLFKKSPIKQVTTEMRNEQQQQQQQLSRITDKNNINNDLNDNSLLFDNLNILVDITPDDNSATPQSHNFNLNS